MTAQQAINQIKSVKTTFMGHICQKYNYAYEIRRQLQIMAEQGTLPPREYYRSLQLTWSDLSTAEKISEIEALN